MLEAADVPACAQESQDRVRTARNAKVRGLAGQVEGALGAADPGIVPVAAARRVDLQVTVGLGELDQHRAQGSGQAVGGGDPADRRAGEARLLLRYRQHEFASQAREHRPHPPCLPARVHGVRAPLRRRLARGVNHGAAHRRSAVGRGPGEVMVGVSAVLAAIGAQPLCPPCRPPLGGILSRQPPDQWHGPIMFVDRGRGSRGRARERPEPDEQKGAPPCGQAGGKAARAGICNAWHVSLLLLLVAR